MVRVVWKRDILKIDRQETDIIKCEQVDGLNVRIIASVTLFSNFIYAEKERDGKALVGC